MKPIPDPRSIREAAVIFLAAVCLGFAFNASSPLGIRSSGSLAPPDSGTRSTAAASANQAAGAAALQFPAFVVDPALQNETINAVIVSQATGVAQPAVPQKLTTAMPWAEVKPLLAKGEIVLVDGRDSLAFEAGHIPGAVSLPLNVLNEKIGGFSTKYPKARPLVIYCASIQCLISHKEAAVLSEQFGYLDVREMPGGYAEWMVAEAKGTTATGGK